MKKTIIACFLWFLALTKFLAQTNENGLVASIPQESIYVHLNSSLLFSGEQFEYKVYCLNNATKKLSDLSKVAYVYLVDQDNQLVFSQKLPLSNGTGQNDFFIPASLPTGSYKLFCLTQWMKNGSSERFFQADVQIINPYRPIPEQYLSNGSTHVSSMVSIKGQTLNAAEESFHDDYTRLNLTLDKHEVGKRQKMEIIFSGLDESVRKGNYSISVRHCDPIKGPEKSITSFYNDYIKRPVFYSSTNKRKYLPELRGLLLSGKLIVKEGNIPATGHKIALSLLGKSSFSQISTTDEEGRFYFNIDRSFGHVPGFFQLLGNNWKAIEMEIDSDDPIFGKTTLQDFTISKDLHDFILQRSIQNQIESSYAEAKQDTVLLAQNQFSLNKNLPNSYDLDDYTRFNSLEETMIEVIDQVWIKTESGKRVFQIRPEEGIIAPYVLPLVFVDGLFIKDHESFMDFSAKKIKSIHFSRDKFFLGSMYFQGILKFETIEGDFVDDYNTSEIHQVALSGPEPSKSYYGQEYNSTASNAYLRIPDFRNQLLWHPSLNLQKEQTIAFYTSDVPGRYEVVFKGFTYIGKPVEIKKYFEVF